MAGTIDALYSGERFREVYLNSILEVLKAQRSGLMNEMLCRHRKWGAEPDIIFNKNDRYCRGG